MRLDKYLVENKNIESRNKAQELIEKKLVSINGVIALKNNYEVRDGDNVYIENEKYYVSRAALKLKHAIKCFNISFKNKNVIDIGSSTGGFVQVAIENGCNIIYAIDVGTNQIHDSLKHLENIIIMENTNFKDVSVSNFNEKIDIITCDVSFISSKEILKKIKELFKYKIDMIFLLKPQFEVGKDVIKKYKGYVPEKYHKKIIDEYIHFCQENNINVIKIEKSPILGAKLQNIEYLLHLEITNE